MQSKPQWVIPAEFELKPNAEGASSLRERLLDLRLTGMLLASIGMEEVRFQCARAGINIAVAARRFVLTCITFGRRVRQAVDRHMEAMEW